MSCAKLDHLARIGSSPGLPVRPHPSSGNAGWREDTSGFSEDRPSVTAMYGGPVTSINEDQHPGDPEQYAATLAHAAIVAGQPTAWFEQVYADAAAGKTRVPWDRGQPNELIVQWASGQGTDGPIPANGARALVVGCGLGEDAEFIAQMGFATTAFDIAPTAIAAAKARFPDSPVEYQVADLLAPPEAWSRAFDLVVESTTVQALPNPPREAALAQLGDFVAPGGTLLVIARRREDGAADSGPPWSLTRIEIDSIATPGIRQVSTQTIESGLVPSRRWLAEFQRDPAVPQR
jgi:SAM-dependent methyltransferase